MNMHVNVTKNFDLRKIKLDLHRELNQGIDIVADDISEGIDKGSQFGKRFADLDEETSRRKGHAQPLIDEGILRDAGRMVKGKATTVKQEATLLPNPARESIAMWNDQGTKNIPAREHWGISTRADDKIDKLIDKTIRRNIDRTRRARIA